MADERDRSEFHKRLVDAIRAHVRIGLGKNALKQAQAGESIMPNYGEAEALADSLAETLKAMGLVVVDAEELHLSEERGNHFAEQLRDARAAFERIDFAHQPKTITEWTPCKDHTSTLVPGLMSCPMCAKRPVVACSNVTCCGWPCAVHLSLYDETAEACVHKEPADG